MAKDTTPQDTAPPSYPVGTEITEKPDGLVIINYAGPAADDLSEALV